MVPICFLQGINSTNSIQTSNSVYSNHSHFHGPIELWSGPFLDFVKYSAGFANFTIEIVNPPDIAKNRSHLFFNSTSPFEECIYAAALGLVDLCVSQYTITSQRAVVVDWFLTSCEDIRLITQIEGIIVVYDWSSLLDKFGKSFNIITQPFESSTWLFLFFCVVPIMGIMFIIHEYGMPGSIYQAIEREEEENGDGTHEIVYRETSIWEHVMTSLYNSFLSVLQGGYEESVVTNGGSIHLLGTAFFIMTILAVCK